MATQADIPAPICEKIREEGENIVYQATNILLHKPPQGDYKPNEPPTIEGEIFLTTPSISEVHYVSKNISPNAIEEDENLNVEVAISHDKKIKEEIPCKEEYIPIEKLDGAVTTPEDPGMLLENSVNKSQTDLEIQSKPLEEIVTNHSNPEITEKANESLLIQAGDSQMECDDQLERESEKLPLAEALAECTNGNESTVIHKVKNEDEDLGKAEIFENEESTCILLKDEALQKEPVESLHVDPEDITASNQGQDTKPSSLEEGSINANLQGITSDYIDEKTIVTQSEVVEVQKLSSIVSNEEIEENSIIKVDSPKTKNEEHLEKEIQEMSSPQPLATEDSGDESKFIPEAQANDGDLRIAELCKNEFSTENIVLKTESKIDEPVESVHVYPEDINASALGQEIEKTSSGEEQTLTAHPQGTLDEETNSRTVDAVEAEKTIEVQNVETIVSNEKTDEDSLIQIDDSQLRDEDHLEKESKKTSFIKHSTLDANDDELTVTPEVKFEEENPKGAELFEREKTIESTSFTEEVQLEKPVESYHEAVDDIKASALDQHTEITSSTDETDLTENTQKIQCDEAEEKTIDVADTKEEILHLQDVGVNLSNKDVGENVLIQVDDSQLKHEEHLEEEIGKSSIIEALTEDANDESTTVHEFKNETEENIEGTLLEKKVMTEKPIEYLQDAHEDNKLSASSDTEIACSSEEPSEIANSQAIMDDKALHSIEKEEVTLAVQNVETIIAHEETEENPKNQVDCSQMENEEHLEKEIENPSLKDSSTGDVKEDEPKTTHEPEILYEDPIKAELLENEKNIETTSEKDEAQIEKSVDSLPKAVDVIKASASGHDTETNPIEEKIPTLNPPEVICGETEEKTIEAADIKDETLAIENVAINVPNEDIEKNSSIPLEALQIEHEVHLEKEIEKPSFTETPIEGANDVGTIIIHEAKVENACLRNVELFDNDTNIENSLLKKETTVEKPVEDLQVATEDNKAFASSDDAKTTYSLEEQIANAQGTVDEKIIDATEEVTLEVENVATSILHGETQENSLSQQTEHEEHLEKESENPTLEESSTGETNDDESKTMHEPEIKDEKLMKAELMEKEKKIESTLENEETLMDKSIDYFQVATKDIEASASGQDTQTSSIEEQILTVKPEEIFCGETDEKTIDAADAKDETLAIENIAINVSNEDIDKNSSFQVDDSQIEHEAHLENEIEKPSLIEASTKSIIDDESIIVHDANIGNACTETVGLFDNDKNIDNSLLKENAPVEKPTQDLQVAADDSKELVSSEDTKTNYSLEEQMANAQGTVEEKTIDATEEVTPEIENVATSIPHGEAQENSLIQAICPQNEYEGNLEKEIENPSLAEASIGNTNEDGLRAIHEPEIRDEELIKAELKENDKNAESTLAKEEVLIENPIDTLQVDTEDIKASFSDRDTETSPIHEQILIVNPKEISDNKTEEKPIDAVDTELEILENVLTNVADGDNEDNSENQIDGSQIKHEEHFEKENEKPSVAEASMGNNNDDKSTVHEVKIVNEDLIKEHLSENEKNVGSSLVKAASIESLQVAPQSDSGLDRETSSLEEQCLTITPQEIKDDNKEDETNDAAQTNEEIPEDKIVARVVANEDTVENSLIQVDESNTHVETESEKLDRNANDESKIMHEASTLEEGLKAKDNEICTGREDHMKDVANQENQDNPVTSNGITEDQSKLKENDSNDVGQLTEEKVDEDSEITVRGDDVEMQNTDNQHYVEAHSEAKEDETIKISSEVVEIYEESNDNTDNSTETNNEEIKVEASNEDEKKEMEPESEVSKETENADNNAKTTKINEEEGYLKDLQVTTAVDIADPEENGSDSITAEVLCAKGLDVNQDTVVTVVEGPNCEQEESFTTDVSEEDTRNVVNTTSLASEASKVNREQTDVETMVGLDDVSAIKPANENLVEAYKKESTESQAPDGEKEAEIMQRDLEAETGEKDIKDEQPINASLDVSETNELNGLEENRNSDSCKEISVNSNTVALEEGETQKQHDGHILANIHSLSTGKTEDDVPFCGATVDESDIPEQLKKIDETSLPASDENMIEETNTNKVEVDETYLPAPDENIIEETDTNKVEVAEDTNDVEHLEQEDATKIFLNDQNPPESEQEEAQCRQEKVMLDKETEGIKDSTSIQVVNDFLQVSSKETSEVGSFTTERDLTINSEVLSIDKTVSGEDQEEEAIKQNVPDLSPAAPVMTEAKSLYEAPEETSICKVAGEGNIVNETSDTTESTVMNNNTDLEDIHVNSKSIEELDTKLEDDAPETKEATWDATKGQEVEVASAWESSGLISERTEVELAFVEGIEGRSNSNELEVEQRENKADYDFKYEVVRELKSQVQEDHTEEGVTRGNQTGDETKGAITEEVTEDNITSVPENEIQKAVLLYDDQETSLEIEKSKDENPSNMPSGVEEKSMELGQEGSLKDEEILNYKVDDVINSNTLIKEIHDPENLEKILESTAQVENSEKISKAEEVKTEEENLEATKEIKSDQIVSEEKIEAKETTYEAEATMKINILSEKIEKDVQEYHLGSCKEDVFVQSHPEDVIKQEQIYKEENFEVIKNASENVKECEVIDEVNDKAVEEPENTLRATESINQKEHVVSVEEITTSFDTEKEAHGLDHVCVKTGTEGSSEEVNSSDIAVLEDENNRKGADDIETEMTKDDGLQIEDSKIPDIDAVARELPELDQNILCEDAPTAAVHVTVEASEGNEGHVNTNIIEQQTDDNNKHESFPLPEFTQGKETKKQDEKDENCSSDDVQAKEEENMILAAGTRKEDKQKADTCSEPIENEDRNTYIETEKLGYTLDTTDKSEVSHSYGTQDIPKDDENYQGKGESSREEYPNESTESQISTFSEDIELIEQDSKATTNADAVLEETGRVSQQAEVSDECEGTKTSKSIESTEIFTSKIMEDYTVRTSLGVENQETQDQLTELHDLPQEPHVKDCEVKMAEKDDQVGFQGVSDIRENMQELNEGSTEVSKEENDLPQESHIKDSEPEMTEKDGPVDLQCVSNIREDVHELNESTAEVSKEENPVVADPSENIEGKCSGGGQEADAVRNSPISETLKQELEEQPISEVNGMNCGEEKKIDENCNDSTEISHIVTKEMVSETKSHQSYMEDAAQSARNHELQMQIDSLPISPSIKCSDTEIAEKDDAKEEVTHISAEDIQSVPEADHIKNVNPEIGDTNISVIQHEASTDCYQEESEILKPSITEQGGEKCHDEVKSSEKSESTEIDKSSLSDLLQVSDIETSKTADHSANEKEPTIHGEYLQVEKPNETEPEETKTDEEKDNEEESCEQKTSDLGSEAPVIVDAGDADVKVAHKKSHNILSGVGSKVKHSIAKVKKVITGKSSHPKPPSPKSGEKC